VPIWLGGFDERHIDAVSGYRLGMHAVALRFPATQAGTFPPPLRLLVNRGNESDAVKVRPDIAPRGSHGSLHVECVSGAGRYLLAGASRPQEMLRAERL
jgi:hypothetical protein